MLIRLPCGSLAQNERVAPNLFFHFLSFSILFLINSNLFRSPATFSLFCDLVLVVSKISPHRNLISDIFGNYLYLWGTLKNLRLSTLLELNSRRLQLQSRATVIFRAPNCVRCSDALNVSPWHFKTTPMCVTN